MRIYYDIPDELHRRCKEAAARRGQSLKGFIEQSMRELAERDEEEEQERRRQRKKPR
jgi:predicted HicB family RNase H-like nuclease